MNYRVRRMNYKVNRVKENYKVNRVKEYLIRIKENLFILKRSVSYVKSN